MGHLSTSERVCSTTPLASTGDGSPPLMTRRAKLSSEIQARRGEDSSPEAVPRAKQQPPPVQNIMGPAASRNIPPHLIDYIPKDQIDMEKYTRNFKGDNILGWQLNAPLKWDKVIQISLLHIVAAFCMFTYPVLELRVATVLFCKHTSNPSKMMSQYDLHNDFDLRKVSKNESPTCPPPSSFICAFSSSITTTNTKPNNENKNRIRHFRNH